MSPEPNGKYLAILFFNQKYKSLRELKGVEKDKTELVEFLSKYKQHVEDNSESILEDLKMIVEEEKGNHFERVHFHFSGHGKYSNDTLTVDCKAKEPVGECVQGTGKASILYSIHDLKAELLKLKADKITVTLDCCRASTRNPTVTTLQERKKIVVEEQMRMFVFHGTVETLEAEDKHSFTQALVSVCKENGGALPILDIEKKVNDKMENQKCEAKRVVSGNNWEDYMWPHQIDKNAGPAAPAVPAKLPQSRQTFHVNVGGNNSGHNFLNNLNGVSVSGVNVTIGK